MTRRTAGAVFAARLRYYSKDPARAHVAFLPQEPRQLMRGGILMEENYGR